LWAPRLLILASLAASAVAPVESLAGASAVAGVWPIAAAAGPQQGVAAAATPGAVKPTEILGGTAGRQLVAALRSAATDGALKPAINLAAEGAWDRIEAALGPRGSGETAPSQVLRGLALFSQRKFDEASTTLRAAVEQKPDSALVAFFLGWAEAGAGRSQAAIDSWRNATEIDPALVPAYLALADAYVARARPDLATQALRAGLASVPRSPDLLKRLADVERR
jgi:tetratricopeptide (TPR) repeat protein